MVALYLFIGIFEKHQEIIVCPKHRDSLGIYWRSRSVYCQIPPLLAAHTSSNKVRGDRTANKSLSKAIFENTTTLIPVGSGSELCH